ncbi:2-hydroxyacid dehydrogenase [Paracoccus aerodenitrificans]|uniref:2-hydroxyacid dehydrogenase n=1 Tax=Paracoccus aerodenitrificans TaxID=3017781 RepID=UPI0022F11B34|nr:glyoxylate/hydroxypyruvate reductase A [Paracoccus aerodenitrificans]WBU62936.1 glyoxylate/hydroxypyruvate reductase A [Paracoccus aerodenitrificans]
MRVLFAADGWNEWAPALRRAMPEIELLREAPADSVAAIIYAPGGNGCDFSAYPSARLVQSLWAGVEKIAPDLALTQPLARMVDPGLQRGMVEYCTGWTLRLHLGMDRYSQDGIWRNDLVPPLAQDRRVTVLGAGALGGAVAEALSRLGFEVAGWSASGRSIDGVLSLSGGQLDQALARADILITLLPDTPETQNILNHRNLAMLPSGSVLINPGRGVLIDDEALLSALDDNRISHAVLDVFRTEPLPPDHPYWSHPKVTVTPHIAAATRAETAAPVVAENLRRVMRGEPPLHLVDRNKGY